MSRPEFRRKLNLQSRSPLWSCKRDQNRTQRLLFLGFGTSSLFRGPSKKTNKKQNKRNKMREHIDTTTSLSPSSPLGVRGLWETSLFHTGLLLPLLRTTKKKEEEGKVVNQDLCLCQFRLTSSITGSEGLPVVFTSGSPSIFHVALMSLVKSFLLTNYNEYSRTRLRIRRISV